VREYIDENVELDQEVLRYLVMRAQGVSWISLMERIEWNENERAQIVREYTEAVIEETEATAYAKEQWDWMEAIEWEMAVGTSQEELWEFLWRWMECLKRMDSNGNGILEKEEILLWLDQLSTTQQWQIRVLVRTSDSLRRNYYVQSNDEVSMIQSFCEVIVSEYCMLQERVNDAMVKSKEEWVPNASQLKGYLWSTQYRNFMTIQNILYTPWSENLLKISRWHQIQAPW
jgi:hypothetical protein